MPIRTDAPTAAEQTLALLAARKWTVDVSYSSGRPARESWHAIAYLKRPVGQLLCCRATDRSYQRVVWALQLEVETIIAGLPRTVRESLALTAPPAAEQVA